MTKLEALEQLDYVDGMQWVNDEYLYKGIEVAIDCIEKILEIQKCITACEECISYHGIKEFSESDAYDTIKKIIEDKND